MVNIPSEDTNGPADRNPQTLNPWLQAKGADSPKPNEMLPDFLAGHFRFKLHEILKPEETDKADEEPQAFSLTAGIEERVIEKTVRERNVGKPEAEIQQLIEKKINERQDHYLGILTEMPKFVKDEFDNVFRLPIQSLVKDEHERLEILAFMCRTFLDRYDSKQLGLNPELHPELCKDVTLLESAPDPVRKMNRLYVMYYMVEQYIDGLYAPNPAFRDQVQAQLNALETNQLSRTEDSEAVHSKAIEDILVGYYKSIGAIPDHILEHFLKPR